MSKKLYEEALADARQLTEVAESNARRAIIDSVTPRIKELIEKQLLGESASCEDEDDRDPDDDDDMLLDEDGGTALGVSPPGTSDETDGEAPPVEEGDDVFEVTNETAAKLSSLSDAGSSKVNDRFEVGVFRVVETTNKLVAAGTKVKLSGDFSLKIVETIQKIEDMYSYLQESGDSARKTELENKLESCFEVLNAVKESTMRMKDLLSKKNLMEDLEMGAEGDPMADLPADPNAGAPVAGGKELTMKITGLPDDVELDKLNIDLISDEDDAGGEDTLGAGPELDADATAPEGAPAEMDMYGESDEIDESDELDEVDDLDELDEDEVVEISETMLEKELARLLGKDLKEMDSSVLDDFGDGTDEGDPWLDGEVSTRDKDNMVKQGSTKNGATASVKTPRKGVQEARKAIAAKKVTESAKNAVSKQLAESKAAIESLRKQLTETNLFSAKLLHANKLLQLEGLTAHQKSVVIDKLDEAQSLREVKLVYEGLAKILVGDKKKTVSEGTQQRSVLAGSSSRTTRSATSTATVGTGEGYETARWAQLAGIKQK